MRNICEPILSLLFLTLLQFWLFYYFFGLKRRLVGSELLLARPGTLYIQSYFLGVDLGQAQFFPNPASFHHMQGSLIQLLRLQVQLVQLALK